MRILITEDYEKLLKELEEQSRIELERELKYLTEQNEELRREVKTGLQAKKQLDKNTNKIAKIAECYTFLQEQKEVR